MATAVRLALIFSGAVTALSFLDISAAVSADLSLQRRHSSIHRHHRYISRAFRDYDGTAVVFRPYRSVEVEGPDGTLSLRIQYEAVWAPRAAPLRYFNGEPVLPHYPRGWPKQATLRYVLMHGNY
jgi:hypothetical protein